MPKPSAEFVSWSCSTSIRLEGAIHCWADDSWYDSLYAGIAVRSRLELRPYAATTSKIFAATEKTVLEYGGQNIDVSLSQGWDVGLGPLLPKPFYRTTMHWVVVSVAAEASWRGESHVMLNFDKGYLVTPFMKYGVYCMSATVFEPFVLAFQWF